MMKGFIALFTSGILTNPLVLLGILCGALFYAFFDAERITMIYKSASFYGTAFFISSAYILGMRKVYKPNGDVDWFETILAVLGGTIKLVLASLLMISFIYLFDFSDSSDLDGNIEIGSEGF